MTTRRRGEALETAILAAAWEELKVRRWSEFQIQHVAARAQTSKSVIYRRWPHRIDLAVAAVNARAVVELSENRWSGELRHDLIEMLEGACELLMGPFGSVFRGMVAEAESDSSPLAPGWHLAAANGLVTWLVEESGTPADGISESALTVGIALVCYRYMATNDRPDPAEIEEIVDTCWLPVLVGGT